MDSKTNWVLRIAPILDHIIVSQWYACEGSIPVSGNVSLLQRRELHLTVDVARQPFEVHHYPVYHLPRCRHAVGQQPSQAQAISLGPRKGDGLVQRLVAQNFKASFHDLICLVNC